jgi:cobalt-zinc-cadmium efflux system membrane fusion protein
MRGTACGWFFAAVLAFVGCHGHEHGQGHGHGEADDHGHGHGAEDDPRPGLSVTRWTAANELFMEYAAFVVGHSSKFAAHVSMLPSFDAAKAGRVTVRLSPGGGAAIESVADAPSSPGIFRPALTPTAAGPCRLTVIIERDGKRDEIAVEDCVVHADVAAAVEAEEAAAGASSEPTISYLKEQAWKTVFSNEPVVSRRIQPTRTVFGRLRPAAGGEGRLIAGVSGRLGLPTPPPTLGQRVTRGQVLGTLSPRLADAAGGSPALEAEVAAAGAEVRAAAAQVERLERLHAEKSVAERQVDEAKSRLAAARAAEAMAAGRLAQFRSGAGVGQGGRAGPGGLMLRSPIDGVLVAVEAVDGQMVAEGASLFTVQDARTLWLEARVFEPDLPALAALESSDAGDAWFTVEGRDGAIVVDGVSARRIAVGSVVDERTRTAPVLFAVDNAEGRLRVGQSALVRIASGPAVTGLAVPLEAILDDGGRPVVFVHVEGEAFARRVLTLGPRDRTHALVTAGLTEGERVVVRGAYEVKLASSSGAVPAHGHAH